MIDFGLYCDLQNELMHNNSKSDINLWAMSFAENNGNSDVFSSLIDNCDEEKIKKLIDYFEPEAPVQKLLQARLKELRKKEPIIENNYDEYKEIAKPKQSFYQYLVDLMLSKGYLTDPDFYNYIGMSRQTFAKMKNKDSVSRDQALLMAVGLELNYSEAVDFLSNAGITFRLSDNREAVISHIMRTKKYTLYEVEDILFCLGLKPLMNI